jgi:hypothetical protein
MATQIDPLFTSHNPVTEFPKLVLTPGYTASRQGFDHILRIPMVRP